MTRRAGRTALGCLVPLLLAGAAVYVGRPFAEAYLADYKFRDRMEQEATFAHLRSDDDIRRRLAIYADSLGLPREARRVRVRRTPVRIVLRAAYSVPITVPIAARTLRFEPAVERRF